MRLVEIRRKQLGRRFFFTVVIPVCVGVIVWLLYKAGVFSRHRRISAIDSHEDE